MTFSWWAHRENSEGIVPSDTLFLLDDPISYPFCPHTRHCSTTLQGREGEKGLRDRMGQELETFQSGCHLTDSWSFYPGVESRTITGVEKRPRDASYWGTGGKAQGLIFNPATIMLCYLDEIISLSIRSYFPSKELDYISGCQMLFSN